MAQASSTTIKGYTQRGERARIAMPRATIVSSRHIESVVLFVLVCAMWGLLAALALQVAAR